MTLGLDKLRVHILSSRVNKCINMSRPSENILGSHKHCILHIMLSLEQPSASDTLRNETKSW